MEIHPATGEVPANLLRAYVSFSAPVRPDVDPRYVPSRWTVQSPRVGTRERLRIDLGGPLDPALALRLLRVLREGRPVGGSPGLEDGQATWVFEPDMPWTDRPHAIAVGPALEDPAGNNLCGAFDRDPDELPGRLR